MNKDNVRWFLFTEVNVDGDDKPVTRMYQFNSQEAARVAQTLFIDNEEYAVVSSWRSVVLELDMKFAIDTLENMEQHTKPCVDWMNELIELADDQEFMRKALAQGWYGQIQARNAWLDKKIKHLKEYCEHCHCENRTCCFCGEVK